VEISDVEIEGLESRSGLIMGDLVTIHGEMMLRGKRRVLSWRRTRANLVSGQTGQADQLVIEDMHCQDPRRHHQNGL
jgi:hypothetical protein